MRARNARPGVWEVPRASGPIRARLSVPPSKSVQQRALALAVLADGESVLEAEGPATGDVLSFCEALGALAGRPVPATGRVEGAFGTDGLGSGRHSLRLDLRMNGTGFRIAVALACLRPDGARTLVTGAPRLRARPVRPLLRALERLGAHAHRTKTGAVRVLGGGLSSGSVSMASDVSSQFATALLLAAPRFGGLALALLGDPVSEGYLRLTTSVLGAFGVAVRRDGRTISVPPEPPRATRFRVEGDASSAAVWWAAAAIAGGEATTTGVPSTSAQPDLALLPVLASMGAEVSAGSDGAVSVRARGRLRGAGEVDLRGAPDLAPLVAVLGAGASGVTRVVGAPHLRHKESDRIASLVRAIRAVGGEASPLEDGFEVRGEAALRGGVVDAEGDHRLVLALGALGLRVPIGVRGAGAVDKSYPGFPAALERVAATP